MKKSTIYLLIILGPSLGFSQVTPGNFTGNLETTFQYLNEDSLIGA